MPYRLAPNHDNVLTPIYTTIAFSSVRHTAIISCLLFVTLLVAQPTAKRLHFPQAPQHSIPAPPNRAFRHHPVLRISLIVTQPLALPLSALGSLARGSTLF